LSFAKFLRKKGFVRSWRVSDVLIYGINPVLEALRAGRVKELRISERAGGRVIDAVKSANRTGIPVHRVTPGELDRLTHGGVHQGIAAEL
jgi:23S rRNA (guanosine2251-2'-O)-methyltransferase